MPGGQCRAFNSVHEPANDMVRRAATGRGVMEPGSVQATIRFGLIRFGLGRRGAETLPADAMAWLEQQVTAPDAVLAQPGASAPDGLAALREDRRTPAADRAQPRPRQ